MYLSDLGSTPVFDTVADAAAAQPLLDEYGRELSCGYVPEEEGGYADECSEPFPSHFMVPRSEWADAIESREAADATIKAEAIRAGIKTVSQNGTNYCWSFGCTRALEIIEVIQGETHVPLSPTAVACKAKNYANRGGNVSDWLPIAEQQGVPTAESWPLNRRDRKYDTSEVWATGKPFKIQGFYILPRNDFAAAISAWIRFRVPIVIGVPWGIGAHMVVIVDFKALAGGQFGAEIWNSHGTGYGDNGFAVLKERAATAFDQFCPIISQQ